MERQLNSTSTNTKLLSIVREKAKISTCQIIRLGLTCRKLRSISNLDHAYRCYKNSLNFMHIVKKNEEVDVLKSVLMTKEQNILFDLIMETSLNKDDNSNGKYIMSEIVSSYKHTLENHDFVDMNINHLLDPTLKKIINENI